MTWRGYIIAAGGILAAFGVGRYFAPTKVETRTETKVEFKDRTVTEFHAVQGPSHTVTVTKLVEVPATATCPAHQEQTITTTTDTGLTVIDAHQDAQTRATSAVKAETTTTRDQPRMMLALSQDLTKVQDWKRLGADARVRVAGPVWLGLGLLRVEDWRHPRLTLSLTF